MRLAPPPEEHHTKSPGDRALLRRQCIAARENLPAQVHAEYSLRIEAALWSWLAGRAPAAIGFYWPVRREFDARPLVGRLLGLGWRAGLPVVHGPARAMSYRAWTPASAMIEGRLGIPLPAADQPIVPQLLLVPVNAFDRAGFRLGYGGGYFDRTLAAMVPRPLALGIGFEVARVASIAPQPHDIPLDAIVSEAGLTLFPRDPALSGSTDSAGKIGLK
jgi:5,10-methenyltetrahydrofolate synthetase